jgi:hypothetical protein
VQQCGKSQMGGNHPTCYRRDRRRSDPRRQRIIRDVLGGTEVTCHVSDEHGVWEIWDTKGTPGGARSRRSVSFDRSLPLPMFYWEVGGGSHAATVLAVLVRPFAAAAPSVTDAEWCRAGAWRLS